LFTINFIKILIMLITVFGATGQVGKRIVSYALAKGFTVRAFGRNVTELIDADLQNDKLEAIKGSVFDAEEVLHAIQGSDAVLSALGGAFDGTDKTRSLGIKTIVKQMQTAGVKRIVALGGSGVLSAPDGGFLIDQPGYPAEFLPVGKEHLQAYLHLKDSALNWTFVCSPEIKDAERTGNFVTNNTYPPIGDRQIITAGDLADFMIKEAELSQHLQQRVGISAS
jgi:hypothetical protein